ncbi:hypothetical protein NC652_010804 [Populus alba x Populus x berolinensis]|nr:hypothetical protein NC652_010804 [Populus alba x Populus x berolinensis]
MAQGIFPALSLRSLTRHSRLCRQSVSGTEGCDAPAVTSGESPSKD